MGRVFVSKDHVFCDGVSGIVRGFYFLRWGEWLTSEDAYRWVFTSKDSVFCEEDEFWCWRIPFSVKRMNLNAWEFRFLWCVSFDTKGFRFQWRRWVVTSADPIFCEVTTVKWTVSVCGDSIFSRAVKVMIISAVPIFYEAMMKISADPIFSESAVMIPPADDDVRCPAFSEIMVNFRESAIIMLRSSFSWIDSHDSVDP